MVNDGSSAAPATQWQVGDVIADLYKVRWQTQGGMGVVYRVHHQGWNIDLAVKAPLPKYVADPASLRNFEVEAETWVGLGLHPNIVACVYVRRLDGLPRVFAEWVDGGSLADVIANRTLYTGTNSEVLSRILDVAIQFAWGLDYAHAQGLIHQDVKPANVMLADDGSVKVTDFGLAKARAATAEAAGDAPGGSVLAGYSGLTPAYCSPEQAQAAEDSRVDTEPRPLTRGTDVWSWAISVWEMFVGEPPVGVGQAAAEAFAGYREDAWSVDARIPTMPPGVVDLVGRCLDSDPATRPRRMGELADELITLYNDLVGQPYPRTRPEPARLVADGLNNQALSMLDLGRIEQAERLWQQALAADPQHVHTAHNYGLHRWRGGEITDTALITNMQAVLASHPDDPDCKRLLAQIHLERCDTTIARMLLTEAISEAPDNADIAAALAAAENTPELVRTHVLTHSERTIWVIVVALSPNGRIALTGGDDHWVRVWDTATGECLNTLTGHTGSVKSVALSADGNVAVSASPHEKIVRIWDVATAACRHSLTGHTGPVKAVAISADGRVALSGSEDQTVRVWDVRTGACLQTLTGHEQTVTSVAVAFDGRTALSGSADGTARVWDVPTAHCRHVLTGHTGGVTAVALDAMGRTAASSGKDQTVRVWDVATGAAQRCLTGHAAVAKSLALSADGRLAVSGGDDLTMRVWDVLNGACLRTLTDHTIAVESVAVSANGRVALGAGDWEAKARLWDIPRMPAYRSGWSYVRPESAQAVLEIAAQVEMAVRQADTLLAAGNGSGAAAQLRSARDLPGHQRDPRLLKLWRQLGAVGRRGALNDAWVQHTLTGHTNPVWAVAVSPDGRIAASGGYDQTVRLWDLRTGSCLHTLTGHTNGVGSVALSGDGRLVLSGSIDRTLRVWDVATGDCRHTLSGHSSGVEAVAVSADGRIAASSDGSVKLHVWDLVTGDLRHKLTDHTDSVTSVALSTDGRVAVSGSGQLVWVWDVSTGTCRRTLAGHAWRADSVGLSADGRIAISSDDDTLRVWDLTNGRCVHKLTDEKGLITSLAVSADAQTAVCGNQDRAARIWDLNTGQCLHTLTGYTDRVKSVALSGDADVAVTPHEDSAIRVWTLDWEYEFADESAVNE